MLVLDIETFSPVDLSETGVAVYAAHPATDVLCAAWAAGGALAELGSWRPGHPPPAWAADETLDVWAWNVAFDSELYDRVLVRRYGWPARPLGRWRCLMARAAYGNLPLSLERCGAVLAAAERKDMAGHRLMMRLARPARATVRSDDPRRLHTPDALDALAAYCRQDVAAEAALVTRLPRLPQDEERAFALDRAINRRGVAVDLGLVDACRRAFAGLADVLTADLVATTGGAVETVTQLQSLARWLTAKGLTVPLKPDGKPAKGALDKEAVNGYLAALATRDDDDARAAARALRIRQALGKASVAKFDTLRSATGEDGRLRGSLLYYGAHQTGRWAGRLVQTQNLPKGLLGSDPAEGPTYDTARALVLEHADDAGLLAALYGDGTGDGPGLPSVLSSLLRCCFVASPGNVLVVADYNAVEARGVIWLANDPAGMRAFKEKRDVYRLAAAPILGLASPDLVSKKDRNKLGKPTVLGGGYGMGATKFAETFHLDLETGVKAIAAYRTTFAAVPRLWREVERAAVAATQDPGRPFHCAGGRVAFQHDGRHLWCRLPSGRALCYRDARIVEGRYEGTRCVEFASEDGLTRQWTRGTIWGGTFVENIVQALCRDLMRDAMHRLEAAGLPVVLHVHDEILVDVPHPGTPEALRALVHRVEAIMAEVPAWASGFPCAVEGFASQYWRK